METVVASKCHQTTKPYTEGEENLSSGIHPHLIGEKEEYCVVKEYIMKYFKAVTPLNLTVYNKLTLRQSSHCLQH